MVKDIKEIGEILRKARNDLKLELEDVAAETKVSEKYLRAIEAGDVGAFPSRVYYNLFVQSYARELGIDAEELLADISPPANPDDDDVGIIDIVDDEKSPPKPKRESDGTSLTRIGAWMGGIIIVVFIVIMIIVVTGDDDSSTADVEQEHPVAVVDNHLAHQTDAQSPEDTTATVTEKDNEIAPPQYNPDRPMRLVVTAKDACWVMVTADGDTVLNRNLEPGWVRNLTANYRFSISAGNPAGLELKLDDSLLAPLSPTGRPVRDLEINQLNKNQFYLVPEETPGDTT
ncbi:MAG: helix-turn-helix domain-containing protein [candidate division Zixibacteria bacterium]|nr:helix-turn-helix domain-containing protein [candidate division Zixibacteria bacterium]